MIKKFTDGLVFGSGFAISFIALWCVAAYLIQPIIINSQIEQLNEQQPIAIVSENRSSILHKPPVARAPTIPFHELGIDEQISQSSAIAIAKYEPAPDGQMKAIITEFLKKDDDITIYYDIGDEYHSSSYYPSENTSYGDGIVIFFTGSPAITRMSMTYSGDRIRGLGDLPIELFRNKCKDNNA